VGFSNWDTLNGNFPMEQGTRGNTISFSKEHELEAGIPLILKVVLP